MRKKTSRAATRRRKLLKAAFSASAIGRFFGYPQCCIDAFEHAFWMEERPPEVQAAVRGGFVPCPTHARQILAGELSIEQLLVDRRCPAPFPDDGGCYSDIRRVRGEYLRHFLLTARASKHKRASKRSSQ